jgi:hypothetical protein
MNKPKAPPKPDMPVPPMYPKSVMPVGGAPVHIIRGPGHKHGKRDRHEDEGFVSLFEFVQEAITKEFPRQLPPLKDVPKLTRKVRATLAQSPEWLAKGYDKPVSQDTVRRALQALRKL